MFEAGSLIFRILTVGRQQNEQDQRAAKDSFDKTGTAAAAAGKQVDESGNATDRTSKKARDAKMPLQEQGTAAEQLGKKARQAGQDQDQQTASTERQISSAKQLAATLTIAGVAVAALVGLSVAKYAEFDQAMSQTNAATMATSEQQEQLSESALQAGADTAYSAREAANAQEELAKAGIRVTDIVGGSLNGALGLAAAGQLGVARSAEIMASTLSQFGLKGTDAARVADVLAAGAGKAQGSVDDLANGLKFVGPVAASMGLSLEETTGVLALFAEQGILGEQAGTSFRGVLASLASPSGVAAAELKKYNVEIFDGNGKMKSAAQLAEELHGAFNGLTEAERSAALGRIFGNAQLTAATILMQAGADGVERMTNEVTDYGYSTDQARIKQDNLAGDIEKLGGAFDTALIRTGAPANDILRQMAQNAAALVDMFGDAPAPVHQVALAVGVATAAMLLFAGGAVAVRARVIELKASLDATGTSFTRTAMIGASAGAALAGVLAIVGLLAAKQAEMNAETAEFADTLDDASGAMTEYTRETIAKKLADKGAFDAAREAGVGQEELTDALYRGGDAYDAVMRKLRDAHDASLGFNATIGNGINAVKDMRIQLDDSKVRHQDLKIATEGSTAATGLATTATQQGTVATQERTEAEEEFLKALTGGDAKFVSFGDGLSAMQERQKAWAEQTATDTESSSDSWEDYYDGFSVDLEEYLGELVRQVEAQTAWEQNMILLAGRASEGVINELSTLGPEGAPLVEQLVNASDEQLAILESAFAERSEAGTQAFADTLNSARPIIAAAGAQLGQETAMEIAAKLASGTATVDQIMRDYEIKVEGYVPTVGVNTDVAQAKLDALRSALDRISGTRTVTIDMIRNVGYPISPQAAAGLPFANGGLVEYYAGGGISEHHVAQMARAGEYRVWAEPETGGEAYIPLSPSKRATSIPVLAETAQRLGFGLVPAGAPQFANGSPAAGVGSATARSTPAVFHLYDTDRRLIGTMRGIAEEAVEEGQVRYSRAFARALSSGSTSY
jgi:TP901 family phage tail tape measure protein